ncbi:MAG: CRISPR-associated DxTHG motif protein [Planctomycetes bacterium]|nr:CRISPR-associated DxTHG motif protein [Planctomycetota bacterium]
MRPAVEGSESSANAPRRWLLTVLGTNPQTTTYTRDGRDVESDLAPVALCALLAEAQRPHVVVALCTAEAREASLPRLEAALDGIEVRAVDVPSGDSPEDVKEFLRSAVGAIPERGVELLVDITHGLRHFAILTYVASLYLVGLRQTPLRGAYYGLLRQGQKSPFLDLGPLLQLPRWFHALEVLRETGSARPMAVILDSSPGAREAVQRLGRVSQAFLSGLPLELGREANEFRAQQTKPLRRLLDADLALPLAEELTLMMKSVLEPFALETFPSGQGWKGSVSLSPAELGRQARIIDALFESGHRSTALGLLSEWTVSFVVWRLEGGRDWLGFQGPRRRAASVLGVLAAARVSEDLVPSLTTEQGELGEYWRELSELRNAHHHHGMRRQSLVPDQDVQTKVERVREYWQRVLRACPTDISLDPGGAADGGILVSPLGMRPGVLFSALHAHRVEVQAMPARCLVICSSETEGLASDAAARAGFSGDLELLCVDPYGGRPEIEHVVERLRPKLFTADRIIVNVTGGTTLMGLAAEAIAAEARSLARTVRRFGLIDRRPPKEQDLDPYQVGEPFWLDAASDAKEDDDKHDD